MGDRLTALVTGSSSGFGELIAKTLASSGHTVFATMRDLRGRNRGASEQLSAWAAERGLALHPIEMDVSDEASVRRGVEEVLASAGSIDVVVNNAGIAAAGPIEAFSIEQVQQVFDTNVFGPLRVNQAVLPHMRDRRSGLIIHISSTLGRILPRHGGLYPSSKWALEGFAESLRYELMPFGVEVCILEPGRFPTPAVGKGLTPVHAEVAAAYAAVTARRSAQPDQDPPDPQEVAEAVRALVELPHGERPLRTVVGPVFTEGVAEFNEAYEQARDRLRASLDGAASRSGATPPTSA